MAPSVIVRGVARAGDRHGRSDRVDRLVAVRHVEGDLFEVRILVFELLRLQAHVRGARVGPVRRILTGEVEEPVCAFNIVQRRTGRCAETAHAVALSVIVRGVVRAGDRHDRVDLVDRLVAVRHVEGDLCEVRILVYELLRFQAHVRGARVAPLRGCVPGEVEVAHLVQRVADLHVVVGDFMFVTVKVDRAVVAGDGNYYFVDRYDGLVAVRDVEGHGAEVRILVRELRNRQAHSRGAVLRPGCMGSTGEVEVLRCVVQVRARRRGVAVHLMLFAVVSRGVRCADDRHGRGDRIDLLPAVRNVEGHGAEVRVRVRELASCQAHVLGARVGLFRFSRSVEGEVFASLHHAVQARVRGRGVAAHCVLNAVIVSGVVRTDNRYGRGDRLDRLIAVRNVEGYRAEVRISVRELRDCQAHSRGTGNRPGGLCRTAEGEVLVIAGRNVQSRIRLSGEAVHLVFVAVIVPAVGCADDGYGRGDRINLLIAVRHNEGDLFEVRVLVHELVLRQAHVLGACVGLFRRIRTVEVEEPVFAVNIVQLCAGRCAEAAHAVAPSVIVRDVARAGDHNGRLNRIDLQGSGLSSYIVLARYVICTAENLVAVDHIVVFFVICHVRDAAGSSSYQLVAFAEAEAFNNGYAIVR